MRRYGLSDGQREQIKDLLPGRKGRVGGTAADNRLLIEAVLYRYRAGIPWRDLPVVTPRRLLADKGYDSDRIRENLLFRGILPVIPPRSNRIEDISCDFRRYRDRNRIERMFNKLKQFRRIATRYDKTRKSFLAFLNLAAVKLWLPFFVNRT